MLLQGLKLNILFFFIILLVSGVSRAEEKFLRVKGTVIHERTKEPLTNYTIKVVEDRLDSVSYQCDKSKFKIWLPANRRIKVYFIKEGYVTKHIYVDASAIPSRAYKKKQQIEVDIHMTEVDDCELDYTKPIYEASYVARDNAFKLEKKMGDECKKKPDPNYTPPFPAPVDTYSGVQPSVKNLGLTTTIDQKKASSGELAIILQGILFADMNYCLFNERTNEANEYLNKLKGLNQGRWGNIKPFDSPEYGKIVMRTVNREQSTDTLFAFGAFIETSRLVFENFTSDSKVLIHLKVFKKVLFQFDSTHLTDKQKEIYNALAKMVPVITDLEKKYTESLKNKLNFEMAKDEQFLKIKQMNQELYDKLVG